MFKNTKYIPLLDIGKISATWIFIIIVFADNLWENKHKYSLYLPCAKVKWKYPEPKQTRNIKRKREPWTKLQAKVLANIKADRMGIKYFLPKMSLIAQNANPPRASPKTKFVKFSLHYRSLLPIE